MLVCKCDIVPFYWKQDLPKINQSVGKKYEKLMKKLFFGICSSVLIFLVKNSHVLLLFDWIYGGQLGLDDHLEVQILILFSDIIHILNQKTYIISVALKWPRKGGSGSAYSAWQEFLNCFITNRENVVCEILWFMCVAWHLLRYLYSEWKVCQIWSLTSSVYFQVFIIKKFVRF